MEHLNIGHVCTTNYTQYIDNSILHLFILLPGKRQKISDFFYIIKNVQQTLDPESLND